ETLRALMRTAVALQRGPFAIRYPRGKAISGDAESLPLPMKIGKGRLLSAAEAPKAIVLTIGAIAKEAAKAVELAAEEGIGCKHYDMIFLKPIDTDILDEAGKSGLPVITVEDGTVKGGLGSAVLEYFAKKGYESSVTVLGMPDKFVMQGSVDQLKALCGLDPDSIKNAIVKATKR
ncbi:MAG: hypothetical protein NC102_10245, partial [Clostridium sp.]|nr:hypothetical protein [Clostridium sp.]